MGGAQYNKCPECKNVKTGSAVYLCLSCNKIAGCAIWVDKGPLGLFGHQEGCFQNQTCRHCGTRGNYKMIGKVN